MGDAFVFFAVLLVSEDQSRVGDLCVITVSKGARFSVAQLLDEVDVLGREWCCSGVSAVVLVELNSLGRRRKKKAMVQSCWVACHRLGSQSAGGGRPSRCSRTVAGTGQARF